MRMNGKMGRLLQDRLAHPFLPLHLALIALLLTLPALWVGWQLDDHFQRLALSGTAGAGLDPDKIFSTLKGDPAENSKFVDAGFLPWWMPEEFRLSFFRYLSVRTMRLDYRLWPRSPALMHFHSLLWFGLLVGSAAAL